MTFMGRALRAAPAIAFKKNEAAVLGQYAQSSGGIVWLDNAGNPGLPAMGHANAATVTGWLRGVTVVAATCAALDTWSIEKDEHGFPHRVSSPFDQWLYEQPNPEMSKQTFYELVFGHLVAGGNAYEYIVFDGNGLPRESWPIAPHRVKVLRLADGRKAYLIDDKHAELDWMYGGQIVHIPGFGYDGLKGYDVVSMAASALGLAKAAEQFAGNQFSEGAVPGGVLSTTQSLTKTQAEALQRRWDERHSGSANANKIAILDRDLTFHQIQPTAEASQLLNTRSFQVVELARLLGVPPHLMADVERSTSWGSGLEEQGRGFNVYTLDHHISRVEDVHTMTILGGSGRGQHFDRTKLVQGSLVDHMGAMAAGVNGRILVPDEARSSLGYPPLPDGKGSEVLIPLNIGDSDPSNNEPDKAEAEAEAE